MIVKGININMHDVNEYVRLQIYLFDKNDIIKIKKEFHIVDDFIIKAFVDINIIKLKDMILDIKKDVIIIDLYKNIQISFIFVNHRSRTRTTIFNNNQKKNDYPVTFQYGSFCIRFKVSIFQVVK